MAFEIFFVTLQGFTNIISNKMTNHKHYTIICPKCGGETSFNVPADAIDEEGLAYRCRHCGWPFLYNLTCTE